MSSVYSQKELTFSFHNLQGVLNFYILWNFNIKKKNIYIEPNLSLMFHHRRWTDTRRFWYSEEGSRLKSITVDGTWRACTTLSWNKPEMNCSTTSLLTLTSCSVFFFSQLGSTYFYKWKHPPAEIYKSHSSSFLPIFLHEQLP